MSEVKNTGGGEKGAREMGSIGERVGLFHSQGEKRTEGEGGMTGRARKRREGEGEARYRGWEGSLA